MPNQIRTVQYIQIPFAVYEEIQSELNLSHKLNAIKAIRNSAANIANGDDKYLLKECKAIVDWIAANRDNTDSLFINSEAVLVPVSILG